jgi:hypothetical protein
VSRIKKTTLTTAPAIAVPSDLSEEAEVEDAVDWMIVVCVGGGTTTVSVTTARFGL